MSELLERLALCIERGKVNREAVYPPDMRDEEGAEEVTKQLLDAGTPAETVLSEGLIKGMGVVGAKFSRHEVFVPDLLMSAKAMAASMTSLRPYFERGEAKHRGTIIIGTVRGDLHDIGKKLVAMVMEGGGWQVVDLGVDVKPDQFIDALQDHPGAVLGLSALLTTTMVNMEETVKAVREAVPNTTVIIGGAPVSDDFANRIGADAYAPDPQAALDWLNTHAAKG